MARGDIVSARVDAKDGRKEGRKGRARTSTTRSERGAGWVRKGGSGGDGVTVVVAAVMVMVTAGVVVCRRRGEVR